ncbi:hypothetical protein GDO86_003929 [Hymenochirus boettgeri]|uniref:Oral-facial-digital syndrome 1 protein n=1 Tax=Hymenochirus boettgeri TaxID=247094 RepID=A0A8T2K8F2_9PIPI|nr:hypothetical protein GDO86_003929 [Hymenochirus boettgeri]
MFTICDLLQLMKINPKSRLHRSLTSSPQNGSSKGFLFQMLMELTDYHLHRENRDVETQTITTLSYKDSVVEKLKFIDEQFEEIYPTRKKNESLESKLSEYRREMEEQLRAEMSQKLQHFKEVEIGKIKLEEKEKSQREMCDFQRELEKTYQIKLEGLVSREKNAIERLQRQQEIEAKEIYSQRQALLKDIELVHTRENDLRQRIEAFDRVQSLEAEKNRSLDEQLRRRELEVKNIEDTFDQKLKNELLRYQIELKEEYMKRTQKVSEDERRNKDEAAKIREETIGINMKKHEYEQAMSRIKELEIEVDSLKAQLSMITRQNHHLTDKLKEMVDYPLIHEEKCRLQAEVKLLKQQIDEVDKEKELFRERNKHPSAEYIVLQEELKRMENARKFDQEEYKLQKESLEKQLQNEASHCTDLKAQLLKSEDSVRKLSAQVEHFEFQLRQAQLALENEVLRNPKPSLVDRSVLDFTASKIVPPDIYVDKEVLKSHIQFDSFIGASGRSSPHHIRTGSTSPDSDYEFVANAKARIKELEKEAEYLDEAYRNYQHRVSQATPIERRPLVMFERVPFVSAESTLITVPRSEHFLQTLPKVLQKNNTILEEDLTPEQHILLRKLKSSTQDIFSSETDITPPKTKPSTGRRLSSTPKSMHDRNTSAKQHVLSDDHDGSYTSSAQQIQKEPLSPIPKMYAVNSNVPDLPMDTEIDLNSRPPKSRADLEEVSDLTKPEKLYVDDFSHSNSSLQDQEEIQEQLTSNLSPATGDVVQDTPIAVHMPAAASPQDNNHHGIEEHNGQEIKEDGNQQSAQQLSKFETSKKEEGPMESLAAKANEGEEKTEKNIFVKDNEETSSSLKSIVNPLEKYMHMVLQNRTEEKSEKVTKEPSEDLSVAEKISNESFSDLSHGETDENFW